MVGRGGAELGGEPGAGAGLELGRVHPDAEAGRAAGSEHRACGVSPKVTAAGSTKTSTQRACGAQAASIGPVTRST